MKLVNSYGGYSIGVYDAKTNDKTKVYKMMRDKRIKYFVPADYSENTEMDMLIKRIIDRTVANEILEDTYYKYKNECIKQDEENDDMQHEKINLLIALENSRNFINTHTVMKKLSEIKGWSDSEKDELFRIGVTNYQVKYILKDADISNFYMGLLNETKTYNENAKKIEQIINEEE